MLTVVDSRAHVTPRRDDSTRRDSTPSERVEFVELLRRLGREVPDVGDRPVSVRCWNTDAHSHGDRSPSMSVNLWRCVWRCHGCGVHGGLVTLRAAAGVEPTVRTSPSRDAALDRLARLGSFGSELLHRIPPEQLERLRAETGRHRRDRVLEQNLRLMLAAVWQQMVTVERTAGVHFGMLDARQSGIRMGTWSDLLHLLPFLGVAVERGDSGRCLARGGRGRGVYGRCARTTVSLTAALWDNSGVKEEPSPGHPSHGVIPKPRPGATLRAAHAAQSKVTADTDLPTFSRRPAIARLMADLGSLTTQTPATGGFRAESQPRSAMVSELVARHGPGIVRTIASAKSLGLVSVVPTARRRDCTLVCAPIDALDALDHDAAAGAARLRADVTMRQTAWQSWQTDYLAGRSRCDRARDIDTAAPWVTHGPGFVRHAVTGEIVPLESIRGGNDHDAAADLAHAKDGQSWSRSNLM